MKNLKPAYIIVIALLMTTSAAAAVFITLQFTPGLKGNGLSADPNIKEVINYESSIPKDNSKIMGYISFTGSETLHVSDGLILQSPLLCNLNEGYSMKFRIELESGEILYDSGLIPPYKGLSDIGCGFKPEPGEYNAKIYYSFYKNNTDIISASLKVDVRISVEN